MYAVILLSLLSFSVALTASPRAVGAEVDQQHGGKEVEEHQARLAGESVMKC
jgi:hypothetical protein